MKVVYLAGPYRAPTEYGVQQNIEAASRVALEGWKLGAVCICPHKNTAFVGGVLPDAAWPQGRFEPNRRSEGWVVVGGGTPAVAQESMAAIEELAHPSDSLIVLSEVFNYDFGKHGLDEPLSDDDLQSISGVRGFLDRVVDLSGTSNPTVRDFLQHSGRGTLRELPVFVGAPDDVAGQLEEWFAGAGGGGAAGRGGTGAATRRAPESRGRAGRPGPATRSVRKRRKARRYPRSSTTRSSATSTPAKRAARRA